MPYTPPPHTTQNWDIRKPAAHGGGGMVVSQVKVAAEAGTAMLAAGGTAADAIVATAFALATLEPWNSGLGGIGFAQVMKPGMALGETFDFGPVAPAGLDSSAFPLTGRLKQDLFAWPEVEGDRNIHGPALLRHPLLGRRLCAAARAARAAADPGRPGPRRRAGQARPAAGLVHHAEGRHLGRGAAALPRIGADLPAERPAAGGALPGLAGLLHPGQAPRDAGAAADRRPPGLLRGRDRRADRGGYAGAGRRALAPPTSPAAGRGCCRRWRCPGAARR